MATRRRSRYEDDGRLTVVNALLEPQPSTADEARLFMIRQDAVATYSCVGGITSVADLCGAYLVSPVAGIPLPLICAFRKCADF